MHAWNIHNRILASNRGLNVPVIYPDCETILRHIFNDSYSNRDDSNQFPSSTPQELADAVVEIVNVVLE